MNTFSRRTAFGALAVSCLLPLSACSTPGSAPKTSSSKDGAAQKLVEHAVDPTLAAAVPAKFKKAGRIRMAVVENYPPFVHAAADGTIGGLDPDIATAVGKVLGLKVEFVPTSFDAFIPALKADKVDIAMSSMGDTAEREKQVDFATYVWNGTMVLVKKGNPHGLTPKTPCAARIGVVRGSVQQTTWLPGATPRCKAVGKTAPTSSAYQDLPQAILALQSGRIDGVLADAPPLLDAQSSSPTLEVAGPILRSPNPCGIAFPKGSKLLTPVKGALNLLMKDGTYSKILKADGLQDIAIKASEKNGAPR